MWTDPVDALCSKAYTSSQLFKRQSDCSVNIHVGVYWLSLRILDLNTLLFALFSVNRKMCWHHTAVFLIPGFLWTLWGFVAAIKTRRIWQLDLMTFRLRASQAQCSPHASLQLQHIKHLYALKSWNPLKAVTEMMKDFNIQFCFNVSPLSPRGLITQTV